MSLMRQAWSSDWQQRSSVDRRRSSGPVGPSSAGRIAISTVLCSALLASLCGLEQGGRAEAAQPPMILVTALLGAPGTHGHLSATQLQHKHFKRAETLYREGRFREALVEYQKAMEAKHHPSIIFNIGQCYRQLGNWKKALFSYQLFLSERPNASNRAEVEQWIKSMKAAIAKQQAANATGKVSVTTQPSGAAVHVDQPTGRPAGTSPAVLTLNVGQHVLFFTMTGHKTTQQIVTIRQDRLAAVNVILAGKMARNAVGRAYVTTTPPGASIHVDSPTGKVVGKSPTTLSLPVGQHLLFFTMADRKQTHRGITIKRNGIVVVDVSMPLLSVKVRMAHLRQQHPYSTDKWFGFLVTWTGLFGATALVAGLYTRQKYLKYWKPADSVHDPKTKEKIKTGGLVTDISLVVASLSAVGAVIRGILIWREQKRKRHKRKTLITPSCGPGGCGVLVRGTF